MKIKSIIWLVGISILVVGGTIIFSKSAWAYVIMCTAFLCILPFFVKFERSSKTSETVLLAVMIALNVVGRIIFVAFPGFKPVAALTIICGMYMGAVNGFMCGSLTALVSNIYFGQGPWTPFQMLSWGLIGYFAGVFGKILIKNKIILMLYAVICGLGFSLIMDVYTTIWTDNAFNISRFFGYVLTALPVSAEYAVSNCIFLLVLEKPIGKKLNRIFIKYGLGTLA